MSAVDIFARADAKQGQESLLASVLVRHLPEVRLCSGCRFVHDYRSIHDPRLFYIHSRWSDLESFESYAVLPETERFAVAAAKHMEHPPLRATRTVALQPDSAMSLPEGGLSVFAPFHARAGEVLAVEQVLRSVHDATMREPGCRVHRICRSVRDAAQFYVHSIWGSETAFEQHVTQVHTVRFIEQIEPLIDHALEVSRMRQID